MPWKSETIPRELYESFKRAAADFGFVPAPGCVSYVEWGRSHPHKNKPAARKPKKKKKKKKAKETLQ